MIQMFTRRRIFELKTQVIYNGLKQESKRINKLKLYMQLETNECDSKIGNGLLTNKTAFRGNHKAF